MSINFFKILRAGLLFSSILIMYEATQAKVKLPSVFGNNMVFQQKTKAWIWGKTDAGKTVIVNATWAKATTSVVANKDGDFKIGLITPSFGGPYTVTVDDGEKTVLNDVLIGDIWVCSGQSNMEMPLAGWGKIDNYEQEIKDANYPKIRLLQANHVTSNSPLADAKVWEGGWKTCNSKNIPEFSSVAYFFAREVFKKTGIPIGLIHTSWGGTIAEAWTSGATLKTIPDFVSAVQEIESSAQEDKALSVEKRLVSWSKLVLANDAGLKGGDAGWHSTSFDATSWKSITLPASWETSGMDNVDGVVWFRKIINVPETWLGKEVRISLGPIDDNDVTFVNGLKVGETVGYNNNREYTIPAEQVKSGSLVISVRVTDTGGGGGIYGGKNILAISSTNGETISLNGEWKFKLGLDFKTIAPMPVSSDGPNRTTVLYNAMINPYLQFPIKGAIWYQGESNADRANQYRVLFPAMIEDWRKSWKQPYFPFYFVQLANFMKVDSEPVPSAWAELRDAQKQALSLPNTGMAVAIDIGNAADIHPKNKQDVGKRLALIALAKDYGIKIPFTGPVYKSQQINGHSVKLSFTGIESGLKTKDGGEVKGFAVAGADKKFHWADAKIEGNQIIVSSTEVANPVSVRYAWANNPICNLVDGSGLPASPFKTDIWPDMTLGRK
ncbi:MAG: 9-O-acetylesterase [Pedobacter sp.]|nr:9-O-acetylesterase [Pedobacter sp.]